MKIRIPASLDEAKASLNGIGALLTAKEWERAAVVYAFTRNGAPGEGGPGREQRADVPPLPIKAFARLGITGLRTPEQVREYRKAWQSAIDDGQAVAVKPGDDIDLPRLPWKEHFGEPTTEVQQRVFRSVVKDPDQFRAAIRDEPEIAVQLSWRVVENPATKVAVEARLAEPIDERLVLPRPAPEHDYATDFRRSINLLVAAVRAAQRGEWQPEPTYQMLAHFVGMLLDQFQQVEGEPSTELFDEIDRYLSAALAGER